MRGRFLVNWEKIQISAREILERLHVDIDVRKHVSSLTLAQKQMVLIARAMREKCRFLILDEPTAPLSLGEVGELFRIVKNLAKDDNVGVIFISHRLPELFQICEELTILKDGKVVAEKSVNDELTTRDIVNLMLGRNFDEAFAKERNKIGETVLKVRDLQDSAGKVRNISFDLRRGEIVGVAGLVGAGKSELCKLLFGATRIKSGMIEYKGKRLNLKTPTKAVRNKIGLVPEERRKEGVLVGEPVYFNLSAACLGKFTNALSFIRRRLELANARRYIEELNIKTPSEFQRVKFLSGGNQQKVAVGKWLASDSDVYLLDEATKGVDVGAKMEIFQIIQRLAKNGKAVLYVSSEISEILALTDRTYVMYNGEFVADLDASKTTENEILYFATGGK
jgi:simple sugar transport system ATP-binding protein